MLRLVRGTTVRLVWTARRALFVALPRFQQRVARPERACYPRGSGRNGRLPVNLH